MTELIPISIESIYKVKGNFVALPKRMALCTPDFISSIRNIEDDVRVAGGKLRLSDLFRSYDMQLKAHMDYKTGRKRSYSPPPGSSFHEAGRAMDVDLGALRPLGDNFLEVFWGIAARYNVVPIISEPNSRKSEAWHFECRGEFQNVRRLEGYKMAVRAAILDIGVDIREVKDDEAAWVQGQILAYGIDIGTIDGIVGRNTKAAITQIKQANGWVSATRDPDALEMIDSWLVSFLKANGASVPNT